MSRSLLGMQYILIPNFSFLRRSLFAQTRVVDNFMKNVLKYVEEGMED